MTQSFATLGFSFPFTFFEARDEDDAAMILESHDGRPTFRIPRACYLPFRIAVERYPQCRRKSKYLQ